MLRQLLIGLLFLPAAAFGTVTVTDRGTGGSNTSTSSITVTGANGVTGNLAAGSLGVLCFAGDNGNGTSNNLPATITDSVGNTWIRRVANGSGGGTANGTLEINIYTAQLTTAFNTSDTLTITFTANVTAKVWTLTEVVPTAGNRAIVVETKLGTTGLGTTTVPSASAPNVAIGAVVIGMAGSESADLFTGDSDSTGGTWSTKQSTGQGSSTSGMSVISQWKITTTSADQGYDVTVSSASDNRALTINILDTDAKCRAASGDAGGGTTTTITLYNALSAGSTGVVCLAVDNAGLNGSDANIPTSLTDTDGNTWTLRNTIINDPGAASGGVEVGIYTSLLATALSIGDTITITYPVSVTAKAWIIWEFSGYTYSATASTNIGTSTGPTLTTGTVTNANVVIGAMGAEGPDTITAYDTDTSNGSWSSQANAATGTSVTGDMAVASQYKIVTATASQTWNLTMTSTDWATAGVILNPAVAGGPPAYLHFLDFFP
jgi:hypothetical protein